LDILIFSLEKQQYGLRLDNVREIVRAVAVTPLPGAPPAIAGIISIRGTIVPVFDLRVRFGLPARQLGPSEHFIVAVAQSRTAALRVDSTDWLASVDEASLGDTRTAVADTKHIEGVALLPDGLVLIHDLDTFLSASESAALDAALLAISDSESESRLQTREA
jgi:purine-binding chemotaxis protein CheW